MAEKKCLFSVSEEGEYGGNRIPSCMLQKRQSIADMSGRKIPEEPSLVDCGGPRTIDVLEDLDRFTG